MKKFNKKIKLNRTLVFLLIMLTLLSQYMIGNIKAKYVKDFDIVNGFLLFFSAFFVANVRPYH